MVPESWEMEALLDLAHYQNGKAFRSEDWQASGLPLIRIPQMNDPGAVEHWVEPESVEPRFRVESGDLLFSWSGTLKVTRWQGSEAALNQHIFNVQPADGIDGAFLEHLISRSLEVLEERAHGTTMRHVTKGMMSGIRLPIPPLPEQQKIAAILSSVDDAIAVTRKVTEQTKRVQKGLLQTLMTRGIGHTRFKKTEIGEIPEKWEVVKLGDWAALQTGPFGSQLKASEYTEVGVPVVMPSNLARGRVDPEETARVPSEITDRLAQHRFRKGDIVFARRGDIGRSAMITSDEVGWLCGTGCLRARPNSQFDSAFLFLAASRHWSCEWLEANALGQTMLNLNTTILGGLPLPLPPLEEQREIATVIRSIDQQVDHGLSERRRLEVLKRGLMQDLLAGRVRVQPD